MLVTEDGVATVSGVVLDEPRSEFDDDDGGCGESTSDEEPDDTDAGDSCGVPVPDEDSF